MRSLFEKTANARGRILNIELIDTGVFSENRYFDVFVEYAKATAEDIAHPHHGVEPGAGGGAVCKFCRRCGFAIAGPGAIPTTCQEPPHRRPSRNLPHRGPGTITMESAGCSLKGHRNCSSPKTKLIRSACTEWQNRNTLRKGCFSPLHSERRARRS